MQVYLWDKEGTGWSYKKVKGLDHDKGFQVQVHGINYDETFVPMAKMDFIRLSLAIVATTKKVEGS